MAWVLAIALILSPIDAIPTLPDDFDDVKPPFNHYPACPISWATEENPPCDNVV